LSPGQPGALTDGRERNGTDTAEVELAGAIGDLLSTAFDRQVRIRAITSICTARSNASLT
jgi:hypothetical protein